MVQAAIHAGTDMAPWYPGAVATGAFGVRWVAKDNNDAAYVWLNAINNAEFRHFEQYGQTLGHDNFNYFMATWEHRFSKDIHTKTESYIMWEKDAEMGGRPSAGPVKSFGGGGGLFVEAASHVVQLPPHVLAGQSEELPRGRSTQAAPIAAQPPTPVGPSRIASRDDLQQHLGLL
jgi:hypothetical protein